MQDEINKAENSAAYNIKKMSPIKQKRAHIDLVNRANNLNFKPFKTMINPLTNKDELHILVHRGVTGFNPSAKGKNMLSTDNINSSTSTDSVHSLLPKAANEYAMYGAWHSDPEGFKSMFPESEHHLNEWQKILNNNKNKKRFTEADAINDLKDEIIELYEELSNMSDESLGKLPKRWKRALNAAIEKING
jgi:hypothetical protein